MPNFGTRFVDGWERSREFLVLAAVPLVSGLLAFDKITRVATFRGGHFGFKFFAVPLGIVDVWQFVSVPNAGGGIGPASLLAGVVGLVVRSVLGAGYFGSVRQALADGEFDFGANVGRYVSQFFVLELASLVAVLVTGGFFLIPFLGILAFLAFVIASYLFYATPYLVVLRDLDVVSAAGRSYDLATGSESYVRYTVGYAVFVFVASVFATAFVVNLGVLGVLVGVVAGAPVGLALNVATMRFVADVDDDAPDLGSIDAGDETPPAGGPDDSDPDEDADLDDDVRYGLDDDSWGTD